MNKQTPIQIREAAHGDVKILAHMWQAIDQASTVRPFGGDTPDKYQKAKDMINHGIKSPNAYTLIAADKTQILGTISGHIYQRPAVKLNCVGVIYSLWVEPSYRCQGIGQQLLDAIENTLTIQGAQSFQVGWDQSNTRAGQWWQQRGYQTYERIASKPATNEANN